MRRDLGEHSLEYQVTTCQGSGHVILNANMCFHDIGVAILVDDVALHGH